MYYTVRKKKKKEIYKPDSLSLRCGFPTPLFRIVWVSLFSCVSPIVSLFSLMTPFYRETIFFFFFSPSSLYSHTSHLNKYKWRFTKIKFILFRLLAEFEWWANPVLIAPKVEKNHHQKKKKKKENFVDTIVFLFVFFLFVEEWRVVCAFRSQSTAPLIINQLLLLINIYAGCCVYKRETGTIGCIYLKKNKSVMRSERIISLKDESRLFSFFLLL